MEDDCSEDSLIKLCCVLFRPEVCLVRDMTAEVERGGNTKQLQQDS